MSSSPVPSSRAWLEPVIERRRTWAEQLLRPFFRRIQVAPEIRARLEEGHREGDVIYTLRAKRMVDPLFLQHILRGAKLPLPAWLHDHPLSPLDDSVQTLTRCVEAEQSALLFLRRPKTITSRADYSEKHVEALLELQRTRERPIQLVPVSLQWRRQPVGLHRTLFDIIFGDRESPGATRELVSFLWQHRDAHFHVGAPLALSDALERDPERSNEVIAKKVRWTILHHLAREEQIRTGPVHRPAAKTRQAVRKDPNVRKAIAAIVAKGKEEEQVQRDVDRMIQKIAADMSHSWLRILDALIEMAWNRIYDGIQVDPAGLEMVREAARRGPVVVVPSHKSHVDYLVLSQVFFRNGMIPPHIAAGENLDFWPVGPIFRRGGAFFLRRKLKGDRMYSTVFAAYVRRLLREGHAVEFFIEGGRSRTGKLLPPKMGMLAMCVEPVADGSLTDVSFIPVSIGYEKIIEASSYARELAGGEKKKEDMGALVRSAKVLRRRYGRVYVDFDEPISLQAFAASRGHPLPLDAEAGAAQKQLVSQLGHRIVYGINRVTRVTPTSIAALVLLAWTRDEMSEEQLLSRIEGALEILEDLGARMSSSLRGDGLRDAIREALGRFVQERSLIARTLDDGSLSYRIGARGRIALDYYKNNVLHYLVPAAIMSAAISTARRELTDETLHTGHVADWALRISRLLKNEVSFRSDAGFQANFAETADLLERHHIIAREDDRWIPLRERDLAELTRLLGTFIRAYRAIAQVAATLATKELSEKKLLDQALTACKKMDNGPDMPEAASQPVLRQALGLFLGEGALERGEMGSIVIADERALEILTHDLDAVAATMERADPT